MKHFTQTIALLACLLLTPSFFGQFQYGPGVNWNYIDGSIYGGITMIKSSKTNPAPGFNLQYETGSSNFKCAIGFMGTLYKANGQQRMGMITSTTDGSTKMVPFDSKSGYFSFSFQMRYYLFDTEDATGHNFFAGAGIGLGIANASFSNGRYDPGLYAPEDPFYSWKGHSEVHQSSFIFNLGAGYQYVFDSGLALFADLKYEQGFMGDEAFMNKYYEPLTINAVSLSAGIKYIFVYDFSNWGGAGYGGGGYGRKL